MFLKHQIAVRNKVTPTSYPVQLIDNQINKQPFIVMLSDDKRIRQDFLRQDITVHCLYNLPERIFWS